MQQRQFALGRTRLELGAVPRSPSHSVVWEDSAESRQSRSIKLVPAFEEKNVTEWFRRYEKRAQEFEWPGKR